MSWREMYERYDELKDLSDEEVINRLGEWWGPIFLDSKEEIRKEEIRKALWRFGDAIQTKEDARHAR